MKKINLVCFILILGLSLKGQSFAPFSENNISFFQDAEYKIYALKVVNKQIKNDSIYYQFNSVWNFDDYRNILPNGISWNGNECVLIGNAYYFFNQKHDSLKIIPSEKVNASWIFHRFSDDDLVVATVSKIEFSSVLGLNDSVKTIVFKRQTKTGGVINDYINDASIRISKNHGFIKALNFRQFPEAIEQESLIGTTNPSLGQTYLTNRKIYDFDVDDEFHYDIAYSTPPDGSGSFSKVIKKVIGKQYLNNSDTVSYTIQIKKENKSVTWNPFTETFKTSVDTIVVGYDLKSDSLYVPDEPIINEDYGYVSYSLYNDVDGRRKFGPSIEMLHKIEDHWVAVLFDPGYTRIFKEGCGLFVFNADNFPGMNHETMVYYKKGNQVWGKPYIINSVNELGNNQLAVYPNPLNDNEILNIRLTGSSISMVELFSFHGVSVSKTKGINDNYFVMNLSNLPKGLYFLEITDRQNKVAKQKIVK